VTMGRRVLLGIIIYNDHIIIHNIGAYYADDGRKKKRIWLVAMRTLFLNITII